MSSPVLPNLVGLGFSVKRSPTWATRVYTAISGKETRVQQWANPRYTWELVYDLLRSDAVNAELQNLVGFFNSLQGSFGSFLFTDADDNSVTDQSIGAGTGTQTQYQMVRTFGAFSEPVLAPNVVTNVKVGGSLALGAYTVTPYDTSTPGILTFTTGTGAAAASFTTASTTITTAAGPPITVVAGMQVYDTTAGARIGTISTWVGTTLTLQAASAINSSGSADALLINAPASGASITSTYSYYFPCRFVDDTIDFEKFMNLMWEGKKVPFISLKS